MIWIILLLILITYTRPWIDVYEDYRGIKHIVLWYSDFKGERRCKFIEIGDQEK